MLIPTDLDRWHPNDITRWLRGVEDDPTVTDREFDQAYAAAETALLGTTAQA